MIHCWAVHGVAPPSPPDCWTRLQQAAGEGVNSSTNTTEISSNTTTEDTRKERRFPHSLFRFPFKEHFYHFYHVLKMSMDRRYIRSSTPVSGRSYSKKKARQWVDWWGNATVVWVKPAVKMSEQQDDLNVLMSSSSWTVSSLCFLRAAFTDPATLCLSASVLLA